MQLLFFWQYKPLPTEWTAQLPLMRLALYIEELTNPEPQLVCLYACVRPCCFFHHPEYPGP